MAHLNLVSIHPFRDGNGRVARIVQSLVLAKEGLLRPELVSIEPYLGRHTREYYAALEEVQGPSFDPARDASAWVEFCIEAHVFEATERRRWLEIANARHSFCERLAREHGYPERFVLALDQGAARLADNQRRLPARGRRGEPDRGTGPAATPARRLARAGGRRPVGSLRREQAAAGALDVVPTTMRAAVEVAPIDPAHPNARYCIHSYFAELDRRFDTGFDPSRSIPADDDELRLPAGLLLVATLGGEPIGCGALKFHDDAPAELKRMWVAESARGLGVGRRLLSELERSCRRTRRLTVRLETNKTLVEAIALYRSAGYVEVAAFNDEPYAHHWFEKHL